MKSNCPHPPQTPSSSYKIFKQFKSFDHKPGHREHRSLEYNIPRLQYRGAYLTVLKSFLMISRGAESFLDVDCDLIKIFIMCSQEWIVYRYHGIPNV